MAAQLFEAAATDRPDAPDRDAQLGADLGVRQWGVLDEQGDQLLRFGGQLRKRIAQRGMALRPEQLRFRYPGPLVRDVRSVRRLSGNLLFPDTFRTRPHSR